jgi:hypothetical protein
MLKVRDFIINDLPLLSPPEAIAIHQEIDRLRAYWILRHPKAPFYSLGATHYFDIVCDPQASYYAMAQKYNPIMRSHFGGLYARLAQNLSQYLNAPVAYPEHLALPGFHIFLYSPMFAVAQDSTLDEWNGHRDNLEFFGSPIHVDAPQYIVDWQNMAGLDFEQTISFTMAISVPASGAGMYVWDLPLNETMHLQSLQDLYQRLNKCPKYLYDYQVGLMALHSGTNYHQIAPIPDMTAQDVRITLQGHGICANGTWQIYW